ncbi:MAG: MBL fold metallo-hydrolase [Proteobacteria bacterium]|nr:MBL fold metallo-hydrolase [Pseudomonadota bacterium]
MTTLFHQDVVVATLGSGSRGNCTYIGDGRKGLLVDCGISTKQIIGRLREIGLGDSSIEAVLVTHEHNDHVAAARVLDNRLFKQQGAHVPFFMTRGTAEGIRQNVVPSAFKPVYSGMNFTVGSWTVEPCSIPHDTRDPVSYVVDLQGVRVGVVTDLGRSTKLVEQQIASMDIAVLEFNHDPTMLHEGPYPWALKRRIQGAHGHLSNAQAGQLVQQAATPRLKHLVLAHLSEENNLPELALEAAAEALHHADCTGVEVVVATQQLALEPIRVALPDNFRPKAKRRISELKSSIPDDAHLQVALF